MGIVEDKIAAVGDVMTVKEVAAIIRVTDDRVRLDQQ
jgi:hypothetical protein